MQNPNPLGIVANNSNERDCSNQMGNLVREEEDFDPDLINAKIAKRNDPYPYETLYKYRLQDIW